MEEGTSPFAIRRATLNDLGDITRIWLEGAHAGFGGVTFDTQTAQSFFQAHLKSQTEAYGYWVAEAGGLVIGWQSLLPCRPNPLSRWGHSSTYIEPSVRARGLGKALVSCIVKHAELVGLSHIEGFIRAGNEAPIRIAESLGFTRMGLVPQATDSDGEILFIYAVPPRREGLA
jgi:L-amino acid N-acyltransferase YncA